jgi:hypothetical protein
MEDRDHTTKQMLWVMFAMVILSLNGIIIEAQYLFPASCWRPACSCGRPVWIGQPPSGAVFAQCVPSHPTLVFPRIHRTGSPLRWGKEEKFIDM